MGLQPELSHDQRSGSPIPIDIELNRIVRFQVAATASEAAQLMALLPTEVTDELDAELTASGQAHRFGLLSQRAYYFQGAGAALNIWSWNEVDSYEEAAKLFAEIAKIEQELSEESANIVYARATNRSVTQPRVILQKTKSNGS